MGAIEKAFEEILANKDKPGVIVAKTVKGKGVAFMEANNDWHHNRITAATLEKCLEELGLKKSNV